MPISNVPFNQVPSNILVPFFWGEFNSGGSPFQTQPRPLLFGQKTTAGVAAAGQVYGPLMSHADAVNQFGVGSMLVAMYDIAAANAPFQPFWALPLADPTGSAAAGSITFTAPGVTGQAILYLLGRQVTFQVNSSDTASMVCVNATAAINAANLPITATQDGTTAGKCDIVARHVGALSNGLEVLYATDQPNVLNSTNSTVVALTGGTGVPVLDTALANLSDVPYDWIAGPYADTASLNSVRTFLNDASGRWAPSQQLFGHYTTAVFGNLSTLVTLGTGRNDQHVCIMGAQVNPTPAWEWAAALCGIEVLHLANPPELSRPLQTLTLLNVLPPRDRSTWWHVSDRQALYADGIAAYRVSVDGQVKIDRMVTTYQQTSAGVADATFRDIETMAQGMYAMRYFRTQVTNAHGRQALADENPYNLAEVTTPKDLRDTVVFAYNDLVALGVAENAAEFAQFVVVVRDKLDANRVNAYIPIDVVNQLRVFAANVTAYLQYNSASGTPLVP